MSELTNWVQAGSAIAGVAGLAIYAWDTRQIRQATLDQVQASRRPFFVFSFSPVSPGNHFELLAKNIGTGHAFNFRVTTGDGTSIPGHTENSVVQSGTDRTLISDKEFDLYFDFAMHNGVRLEYEDLAGTCYWSAYKNRDKAARQSSSESFILSYGIKAPPTALERLREWDRRQTDL